MNGNILRRRVSSTHVHNPIKILSWVGASGNTKSVRFKIDINLTSTMTFAFNVHPKVTDAALIFLASTSYTPYSTDANRLLVLRRTGYCKFEYFNTTTDYIALSDTRHILRFDNGFWVDDTKVANVSTIKSVPEGGSIWISGYKIYGFKVWDNGILIANFVPAQYDDIYGLWDTVKKTFVTADGSNPTNAGQEISKKMSIMMSQSYINDNPTILYNGNERWEYKAGLLLFAILDTYDSYSESSENVDDLLGYTLKYYHDKINQNGIYDTVGPYLKSDYNSDNIMPGFNLFRLMQLDTTQNYIGDNGYYASVINTLFDQLEDQPRLVEPTDVTGTLGHPYQHKAVYAYQHWLDGLFMTQPFAALYSSNKLTGQEQTTAYADIVSQLINAGRLTYDQETQLYRHAFAGQGSSATWADSTGKAYFTWGRALGWYIMGIICVLDIVPTDTARRDELIDLLTNLLVKLQDYKDSQSGVWRLLPTEGTSDSRNILEATSSCMYAYGYLHGVRMGYLPVSMKPIAKAVYESVIRTFVEVNGSTVLLKNCVTGGNPGASSTTKAQVLENYYGKEVKTNDLHGVGPFILASLDYELLFGNVKL